MAIYVLEVSPFSRTKGESMVLKAAYRSGTRLVDRRIGKTADYTRRAGVEHCFMTFPYGIALDREQAWNDVEHREKRRDACVGRQILFALPAELSAKGRMRCARRLAQHLVDQNQTFVDCAIHMPNGEGDQRNFHVHVLMPTRRMDTAGNLTTKMRDWDDLKLGPQTLKALRAAWADIANDELARENHDARIDHRSNRVRQIADRPGIKLGVAAIGFERRAGEVSSKRRYVETPIEVDLKLIAALVLYRQDLAKRRGTPSNVGIEDDISVPPEKPDLNISAILARLRRSAELQIKAQFAARLRGSGTCHSTKRKSYRLARQLLDLNQSPVVIARLRDRHSPDPLRIVGRSKLRADVRAFEDVSIYPALPKPVAETISLVQMCKAYAFAFAILEATSEASTEDLKEFLRGAIRVTAGELGLDVHTELSFFRDYSLKRFPEIIGRVIGACQQLLDLVGAKITHMRAGYPPTRQLALDTRSFDSIRVILSSINEVLDRPQAPPATASVPPLPPPDANTAQTGASLNEQSAEKPESGAPVATPPIPAAAPEVTATAPPKRRPVAPTWDVADDRPSTPKATMVVPPPSQKPAATWEQQNIRADRTAEPHERRPPIRLLEEREVVANLRVPVGTPSARPVRDISPTAPHPAPIEPASVEDRVRIDPSPMQETPPADIAETSTPSSDAPLDPSAPQIRVGDTASDPEQDPKAIEEAKKKRRREEARRNAMRRRNGGQGR